MSGKEGMVRMGKRKRGNRNWGKPMDVPYETKPTEFEAYVAKYKIPEHQWPHNEGLRRWCHKNRNRVYIPESLLQELQIEVTVNAGL